MYYHITEWNVSSLLLSTKNSLVSHHPIFIFVFFSRLIHTKKSHSNNKTHGAFSTFGTLLLSSLLCLDRRRLARLHCIAMFFSGFHFKPFFWSIPLSYIHGQVRFNIHFFILALSSRVFFIFFSIRLHLLFLQCEPKLYTPRGWRVSVFFSSFKMNSALIGWQVMPRAISYHMNTYI